MKNKKIYFVRMRHRFNFEIWWIGCSLMTFLCFYCSSAIFQLHKDDGVLLTLSILLLGLIFAFVGIIATVCYPICGVYIENEKVYVRKYFKKKEIKLDEIEGITILRSTEIFFTGRYSHRYKDLLDKDKSQLYSIVFLKKILMDMENFSGGDLEFLQKFGTYSVYYCVYDQKIIKFLLRKKPDIKIILSSQKNTY